MPDNESKTSLPEVTLTAFVISLSTAALQNLGAIPDEQKEGQDGCVNLGLAKQTIDILEMLEAKTKGNLSDEENKLLTNLLYDLRMRYVKIAKQTSCE